MSSCDHNCGSCGEQCSERGSADLSAPLGKLSTVRKVIAIVSGKGGVGKSLVTGLVAAAMAKRGKKTAILDADITGPSIPKMFGIHGQPTVVEQGLIPMQSKGGVDIVSMNMLLPDSSEAVLWRGPILAGVVKQFWSEAIWKDIDVMFVDMPPGTGDIPLTVFQSLPVDGILVITSPQDLVAMIVEKPFVWRQSCKCPSWDLLKICRIFSAPTMGNAISSLAKAVPRQWLRNTGFPCLPPCPSIRS